jgi:CBS domain-containing protein
LSSRARRQILDARPATIADVMLTEPTIHNASVSVAALRQFFSDDHVHMALLVDAGSLITTVERNDLGESIPDTLPARTMGRLRGRTIGPNTRVSDAMSTMQLARRRRLAVVNADGTFLGLLCLKASGDGFCSEPDVRERRRERATGQHAILMPHHAP